jgi:hypothetical protein
MIALFLSFSVRIQNAFAAIVHTLLFRFGSVHEWPIGPSIQHFNNDTRPIIADHGTVGEFVHIYHSQPIPFA